MSSFVRNLILYKIYDEITKEDEKRILKRQEKSKLEKNKFS
jgi:toxin-antitoxin system protein